MRHDGLQGEAGFASLAPPLRARLAAIGQRVRLAAGTVLFRPGQPCARWLLVVSGTVRVSRNDRSGRAMTLYRVGPGEACILTTAGLLEGAAYDAEAVAESEVEALVLPAEAFLTLVAEEPGFRRFAFAAYARRIASLMALAGELAFDELGTRLARLLLALADGEGRVPATHERLAAELGTAREVVSRRLKAFERSGHLRLARGAIVVADRSGLAAAADGAEEADLP